ncbi:hypothetical protein C8F04DRAFT_1237155 [Mycena alexandri]|uniref:Nucleoprotein TPR/MLP1 domain-containing protein n=1 Tax=Mycena alexandri TaxID=1745969 RepID=A0AAD6SKG7_9AGAR|nr:hypothetical protein C8F04DRAFT_1237155 [Mycena alexandri]
MMKTRRKSKAAAAAAADPEHDPGSPTADDNQRLTVFIPSDVDLDTLSNLLPETSITSQSPEGIIELYRRLIDLASKLDVAVRERDEDRAEVERIEVEMDQALQDKESLTKELEGSSEALQAELKQVKQQRDELLTSQAALQAQISSLSTSQTSSSTEVDNLKHRVEDTEREKRDLVGVISRMKQDDSQRQEEIQNLRANLKEARQEHQTLESQVRELRSSETSTKLQLSQAEAERTNAELTAKSDEYSKHRRTKHAELVTLQANFDALTQTHASTQATLKALQSTHTAQTHQLTQALARVQDLTGQLADQEATYASEAKNLRRLVAMMEEREIKAKQVVDNIERDWADVGDKADRREAVLRDEVQRERKAREEAERRTEQLEEVLERMGRGDLPVPGPRALDFTTDGMMGLSPTVAMVSKAQKSGKTFTEVYADYVRLQDEFAKKCTEHLFCRNNARNTSAYSPRPPTLPRNSPRRWLIATRKRQLAQENSQKLARSTRENDLLQQQLTDLGRQIQNLLRELSRRDDPSIPSDADIEMLAAAPAETIDGVITNNLVLFQSIGQLQEQNQKLLKIVRELGDKMEGEERDYREAMEREQGEAVREAHEAMQELADQLERQKSSSDTIIKAYVKERDALKAMLARVEHGGAATNGMSGDANGFGEGLPPNSSDMAKELAEMQNQFETYRTEMGVDSVRLREELLTSQREVGQLGAALAKANARIEYLSGTSFTFFGIFAHLIGCFRPAQDEPGPVLHPRSNSSINGPGSTSNVVVPRRTCRLANGRIEQLRNECANLRAEKKIWEILTPHQQSVQGRLVEENKTLAMERSHLSDLMGNVQKMHNDLENSGANDRRRLENQVQMYEGQNQDLRVQLSLERDATRHVSLQKDIEVKELQTRLDKAVQDFSKTRESLVGAETSKMHLEQRVEELARQLQGNEEKLAVYERRSSVAGIAQHMDQDLSREQQLEAEVAELRSALKVTEVDLATARSHVQQFRQISEANEAALNSLDTTHEEYKSSTEAQIARHEEKLAAIQQELTQFNAKYNELQKSFDTERTAWTNDKKSSRIRLSSSAHLRSTRKVTAPLARTKSGSKKTAPSRTQAAEERYTQEVVAHAESIKAVDSLKKQLSKAQATARDHQTAAETAIAKLTTSESSWALQKDALDKEVSDLNRRCQDLTSQNSLLHQHLESLLRVRPSASGEGESADDTDTKLSELRSVVAYLRKEKEIVDLQLELSKQENTRPRFPRNENGQSKLLLRLHSTAELVERINQLNILRESNATLRTDCENHAKRSRELEAKLKQLSAQLNPAKEQARVAQAELEARASQMARLEEENRKWQERNTQLLSKYDRIDPAEVQSLKDEIEQLKTQVAAAESFKEEQEKAFQEQQTHTAAVENNLRTFRDTYAKNNEGFKARLGQMNAEKSAAAAEKQGLVTKIAALESEIKTLQESKASSDADKAYQQVASQAETIAALRTERDALLAEKSTWVATASAPAPAVSADVEEAQRLWEAQKAELTQARDAAQTEAKDSEKKYVDMKAAHDKLMARARQLAQAQHKAAETQAAAVAGCCRRVSPRSMPQNSKPLSTPREQRHPPAAPSAPPADVAALIAAAIAKHDEDLEKSRADEINAAVERGRAESASRAKVKDQQLVKAQKKVKDLEAQILAWQKEGVIPNPPTPSASTSSLSASAPAPVTPSTSTSDSASTAKPTGVARGGVPAMAARGGAPAVATRGAAPGATRGGPAARGAAPRARGNGLSIRGGATRAPPVASTSAAAPPADRAFRSWGPQNDLGRRARLTAQAEASLAKRLKSAEPAAKPPVTLRRPAPS